MGAWGVGHFDNDDAGDWVWELEEAKSLGPVDTAISTVESSTDYLEAPDASIGLAAAETVAASIGRPCGDLPRTVAEVVAGLDSPANPDLVSRTRSAVVKIGSNSELKELWEETDDFAEWQSKVNDLASRLE